MARGRPAVLAEDGNWFRNSVNTTIGLDMVTFGDSQLNDQFDVYLPYPELSALHVGAIEAPNRMTILEIHDCRPEEQQ